MQSILRAFSRTKNGYLDFDVINIRYEWTEWIWFQFQLGAVISECVFAGVDHCHVRGIE